MEQHTIYKQNTDSCYSYSVPTFVFSSTTSGNTIMSNRFLINSYSCKQRNTTVSDVVDNSETIKNLNLKFTALHTKDYAV